MKRLRFLLIVFCLALAVPLAYFVHRTQQSLDQEERAELRYFAETLFDRMEDELAVLISNEEKRGIDEYSYFSSTGSRSPLSFPVEHAYIIAYFQNSPDGSIQNPLFADPESTPDTPALQAKLENLNSSFNLRRRELPDSTEPDAAPEAVIKEKEKLAGFADKYLLSSPDKQKARLGQEKKRLEEITVAQAKNIAQQELKTAIDDLTDPKVDYDVAYKMSVAPPEPIGDYDRGWIASTGENAGIASSPSWSAAAKSAYDYDIGGGGYSGQQLEAEARRSDLVPETFQVEVAPMQSVSLDKEHIFIFRRIAINNQVYRQGFVVKVRDFMQHLINSYFIGQPLTEFTNLKLKIMDAGNETTSIQAGSNTAQPDFLQTRTFPRPFSFLHAVLACDRIPRSAGRSTLNIMMSVLAAVILLGLFAIYQSTRVIVDLSERRAGFVSSVTHELKTPLTNIRMYIEMLEQGIAKNKDREEDYFRILNSESNRLTRLINNVLEFSKLEKKQRQLVLTEGNFSEVISEVKDVMREKMRQEDFSLTLDIHDTPPFKYDREGMIQVLINLLDNSIKFGRNAVEKEITIRVRSTGEFVEISVVDNGPGIERHALKKIFNDFYRVDNSLTRDTKGTGIGLALVKKIINAMGGTVAAVNNSGPGCTITISLPI